MTTYRLIVDVESDLSMEDLKSNIESLLGQIYDGGKIHNIREVKPYVRKTADEDIAEYKNRTEEDKKWDDDYHHELIQSGYDHWLGQAQKLIGRTIIGTRVLRADEVSEFWYSRPFCFWLDDGSYFYPTSDDECNNGANLISNLFDKGSICTFSTNNRVEAIGESRNDN